MRFVTTSATPVRKLLGLSVLETAQCLKTGKLQAFSEQFLVSCDDSNYGCSPAALDFVKRNGGVCSSESYPYASGRSQWNEYCDISKCQKVNLSIQKLVHPPPSEQGIVQAPNQMPLADAVTASSLRKQYRCGVLTNCADGQLNHAVVAVGYGTSGTTDFYKIKNSWGSHWVDGRYIRISRKGATCGMVNRAAVYPVL